MQATTVRIGRRQNGRHVRSLDVRSLELLNAGEGEIVSLINEIFADTQNCGLLVQEFGKTKAGLDYSCRAFEWTFKAGEKLPSHKLDWIRRKTLNVMRECFRNPGSQLG